MVRSSSRLVDDDSRQRRSDSTDGAIANDQGTAVTGDHGTGPVRVTIIGVGPLP
jgi:hypothetical protein